MQYFIGYRQLWSVFISSISTSLFYVVTLITITINYYIDTIARMLDAQKLYTYSMYIFVDKHSIHKYLCLSIVYIYCLL